MSTGARTLTVRDARRLALSLPGSAEQDHHAFPSFRVGGKIFAALPDANHLNVMAGEHDVHAAVTMDPATFEELWWGGRLRGVRIDLRAAAPDLVADLLEDAWRQRTER